MQNKFKLQSSHVAFILGNLFGAISLFSLEMFNALPQPLYALTFLFGRIGFFLVEIILWPICKFNTDHLCRGLGLDGGPLVWVEWTGLFVSVMIGYGFVFLLVYMLFQKMRS